MKTQCNKAMTIAILVNALIVITLIAAGCTKKVSDTDSTLNIALSANIKGLDPISANDQVSATVISHMYESLLTYDYLKRPYTLLPNLAAEMPKVSSDGLTYTFKIKKGVFFHDNSAFANGKGRELVANDFIYSWRRLADPRNQSEGFWIFDGKVKGLNEWAAKVQKGEADYSTPIEGLSAPDTSTLVIKLAEPYYQLLPVLAMQFSSAVPKEAVDKYGKEFLNNPVGTGPYKLVTWVRNSKLVLEKNPQYHGKVYPSAGEAKDQELLVDAGKPVPFAEKMTFTELIEDQPRWLNFMRGEFDFLIVPNDNYDQVISDRKLKPEYLAKGYRLSVASALYTGYFGINMKDPILGTNKALRQAMALAYDAAEAKKKFANDRGQVAQGPIPPGMESYDEKFKNPYQGRDVEKAKALLAKAGFPNGKGLPELTFETTSDSKTRQTAEFFAQQMADIGIKIKISSNSWPQLQDKIKTGKAQLFRIAWGADYPDPQNFFQLFYSKNAPPGPNDTQFSNKEFDALYEKMMKMAPGAARNELFTKMRDIVVEESPWIFGSHNEEFTIYHSWLGNFKSHPVMQNFADYLKIDPKKRAENKPNL